MNEEGVDRLTVAPSASIRDTMEAIDAGGAEIALIVENGRMIGTASDGDVRRALLRGATMDDPIGPHTTTRFVSVGPETDVVDVLKLMRDRGINQVPVLDANGHLLSLHVLNEMLGVRIPLSVPVLGGNAERYLRECVDTNFVSSVGPFVNRFEQEFASEVGVAAAVGCTSGTAAIHLALVCLNIGAGDEVWVSDLTFIASVNPVIYCGANPTLVDSERASWNLDPEIAIDELERRATAGKKQPACIVLVHLLGHPADAAQLMAAAASFDVPIVEDAAESFGAYWTAGDLAGRATGSVGKIGCFSFNGNKIITTGGGGMLVTNDREIARRARHLSTQAKLPGVAYRHDEVGFNYRMTNVGAALGVAQLERFDEIRARKAEIFGRYDKSFRDVESIELPPALPWARRSDWLYTALFPNEHVREAVHVALRDARVDSRPIWLPLHQQAPYRDAARLGSGAVAEGIAARALSLPCSVSLGEGEQAEVIEIVRRTVGRTA